MVGSDGSRPSAASRVSVHDDDQGLLGYGARWNTVVDRTSTRNPVEDGGVVCQVGSRRHQTVCFCENTSGGGKKWCGQKVSTETHKYLPPSPLFARSSGPSQYSSHRSPSPVRIYTYIYIARFLHSTTSTVGARSHIDISDTTRLTLASPALYSHTTPAFACVRFGHLHRLA